MKFDIFNGLNKEELLLLNESRTQVVFNRGELILKQGTELTHVVCITNGCGIIYIEGINKKNLTLSVVQAGDLVAGPGMFHDNRAHYTLKALNELTACLIKADTISELVKRNTNFAFSLISHINEKGISNFDRMINLTQKQMNGRIADVLLYLAKRVYKGNRFESDLSRQDIADMAAMSKESAIRVLKELKDENIIELEGDVFSIKKMEALEKISKTG